METEGFGMGHGIELEEGGRRAGWWFGAQVRLGLGCGLGIGLLDLLGGFGLMGLRIFEVWSCLGIGFRWVLGILGVGLGEFWV